MDRPVFLTVWIIADIPGGIGEPVRAHFLPGQLLVIALLYVWLRGVRKKTVPVDASMKEGSFWKEQLLMPHLLVVSVLLGMFQWTNFWFRSSVSFLHSHSWTYQPRMVGRPVDAETRSKPE